MWEQKDFGNPRNETVVVRAFYLRIWTCVTYKHVMLDTVHDIKIETHVGVIVQDRQDEQETGLDGINSL